MNGVENLFKVASQMEAKLAQWRYPQFYMGPGSGGGQRWQQPRRQMPIQNVGEMAPRIFNAVAQLESRNAKNQQYWQQVAEAATDGRIDANRINQYLQYAAKVVADHEQKLASYQNWLREQHAQMSEAKNLLSRSGILSNR